MGRATDQSTERRHRHWQENNDDWRNRDDFTYTHGLNDGNASFFNDKESDEDETATSGQDDISNINNSSDTDDDHHADYGELGFKDSAASCEDGEENPLKKSVVDAVMNALKIMKEGGTSIRTFEEILEYGKNLLLAGIDSSSEDIDRDVLMTLWPRNWAGVQKLLQEEGYEDAKEYSICFCREEKTTRKNNKKKW